jgi:hypothetical protein
MRDGEKNKWVQMRVLDAIAEIENALRRRGFPLPLAGMAYTDFGATMMWKVTRPSGEMMAFPMGSPPASQAKSYLKTHAAIPGECWVSFGPSPGQSLGFVVGARCIESGAGTLSPASPYLLGVGSPNEERLLGEMTLQMFIEGLRQQLALGQGVKCAMDPGDGSCCGLGRPLWRTFAIGEEAKAKAGWRPTCWLPPTCCEPSD